jgi:hypothetical protein
VRGTALGVVIGKSDLYYSNGEIDDKIHKQGNFKYRNKENKNELNHYY